MPNVPALPSIPVCAGVNIQVCFKNNSADPIMPMSKASITHTKVSKPMITPIPRVMGILSKRASRFASFWLISSFRSCLVKVIVVPSIAP
jgi:hypothetical protein